MCILYFYLMYVTSILSSLNWICTMYCSFHVLYEYFSISDFKAGALESVWTNSLPWILLIYEDQYKNMEDGFCDILTNRRNPGFY